MNGRRALAALVLLIGLGASAPVVADARIPAPPSASAPPPAIPDDDPVVVEVVTFGPGDHPFSRFGHNALRIRDRRTHADLIYNFGTFSIVPGMVNQFLHKTLRYWLLRGSTAGVLASYQAENRSIEVQRLNLTPAQKSDLVQRLDVNARPENREYKYDYFLDNCSTRVRDTLDVVLGGRVRAAAGQPASFTLRDHALRMVSGDLSLYLALLIVLGPPADRPIDAWTEDFLPQMLQRTLRQVTLDEAGHPLVAEERTLFEARRVPPPPTPPRRWPFFLMAGLLAAAACLGLARWGRRAWFPRALFGLSAAVFGLVSAGLGGFLLWAWVATPHLAVHRNQNILLFTPFVVAFLVLGPGVALGRAGAVRAFALVAAVALACAVVACLFKLLPFAHQANGSLILFMLPLWTGYFVGARLLRKPA
ncbi:MAG TPA: DUF4105 domain-containing protein [Polyangia bacterium]|nr:DUF4105 domain-containing protein [Polyangia bacterium]